MILTVESVSCVHALYAGHRLESHSYGRCIMVCSDAAIRWDCLVIDLLSVWGALYRFRYSGSLSFSPTLSPFTRDRYRSVRISAAADHDEVYFESPILN